MLAVADKTGELKTVVQNFKVKPSALINKQTSKGAGEKKGKKPRRGKNNVSLHDVQSEMSSAAVPSHADISCPKAVPFTAIYHNEEPFSVEFLCDIATKGKKVLMCESCKVRFPSRPLPPSDIVLLHNETYMYPVKDAYGVVHYKPTILKMASRYYCVKKTCLLQRHPYFWIGLVHIEEEVLGRMHQCHLDYLLMQLGYV